jgi:alkylation response protein AidB-like acyl-CoA dehydrogenase
MQHDVSAVLADLTSTAQATAREHAVAVDRDRAFPRATIDALAAGGALGLMVPEASGGAGGGLGSLAEAATEVRTLQATMDENRRRRLRAAGFDDRTARYVSELHTPNLM